jgi:hypothetical protein
VVLAFLEAEARQGNEPTRLIEARPGAALTFNFASPFTRRSTAALRMALPGPQIDETRNTILFARASLHRDQ